MQRWFRLGFLILSLAGTACGGDDDTAATITAVIGPEGGTVELAGGGKVEVPAGALSADTKITITKLNDSDVPALPEHLEAAGKPYAFKPHGLTFAEEVKIEIPYEGIDLNVRPMKLPNEDPALMSSDWTTVFPNDKDGDTNKLSMNVESFSVYMAARPRRVSGVLILPDGAIDDGSVPAIDASMSDATIADASTDDASLNDAASTGDGGIHDGGINDSGSSDGGSGDASMDGGMDASMSACGCDPLVVCMGPPQDPSCGPCPIGYVGSGFSGCIPALTGLTVTPGVLLPTFDVARTDYLINVGFADTQVTLTPTALPASTITIGAPLTGPDWTSPVLAEGPNDFTLDVSQPGRTTRSHAIRINRGVAQEAVVRQAVAQGGAFAGWSIGVSGDVMIVGATGESSAAINVDGDQSNTDASSSGAAFVFARTGNTWAQQAYLKPGVISSDGFGTAVTAAGDTVVVGSAGESSNATGINGDENNDLALTSGAAYVFVRSGSTWTRQAFIKASNTNDGDRFGSAIAMSGDTLVVGAHQERSNATGVNGNQTNNSMFGAGAAYVFVRNGTTWTQEAYLKASNTAPGQGFGNTVAISGDTIVIGAVGETSNATGVNGNQADNSASQAGAAYVFVRNGTTWTQEAYLKASNTFPGLQFGGSVAVSGDTIVVGGRFDTSNATGINGSQSDAGLYAAGAAYVFDRVGTTWSQSAYVKASNTSANAAFGEHVAISGDTMAISAGNEDHGAIGVNGNQLAPSTQNSGAVYEFVRVGGVWSQRSYIKSDVTGADNEFCWSMALDNGTIVVGAPQESTGEIYSGAAWIFR